MADYSVATTKNNLSSLIDKALAGEEVIITRHGKPTVSLHVVTHRTPSIDVKKATARLQARLAGKTLPIQPQTVRDWLYEDDRY